MRQFGIVEIPQEAFIALRSNGRGLAQTSIYRGRMRCNLIRPPFALLLFRLRISRPFPFSAKPQTHRIFANSPRILR